MATIIYKNASIVALNEEALTIGNQERKKQSIQLTENTRDGMLIVGGIEAWDDSIEKMGLVVGATYAEIHCRVASRYKDGKWWWSVQAYKAVKDANEEQTKAEEGADPFAE